MDPVVGLGGGGGRVLAKGSKPGYPKSILHRIKPLLFERGPNSLSEKNNKMPDLTPARGSPQIVECMTEVDIFDVEEKCAFFNV